MEDLDRQENKSLNELGKLYIKELEEESSKFEIAEKELSSKLIEALKKRIDNDNK
jgi:anti-sigma28 factor (negative regulator of flagellin synthesis)